MSIADSTNSSIINWNTDIPLLAPQPTSYLDPISLPVQSNFVVAGPVQLKPACGPKFLNAVSGGHPSLTFQQCGSNPNDLHWVPGAYQPNLPNGLLMGAESGNGPETLMHGYRANIDLAATPVGVVPGEYLTSSAEMTPDEVFTMDREEYFTQSFQ